MTLIGLYITRLILIISCLFYLVVCLPRDIVKKKRSDEISSKTKLFKETYKSELDLANELLRQCRGIERINLFCDYQFEIRCSNDTEFEIKKIWAY